MELETIFCSIQPTLPARGGGGTMLTEIQNPFARIEPQRKLPIVCVYIAEARVVKEHGFRRNVTLYPLLLKNNKYELYCQLS